MFTMSVKGKYGLAAAIELAELVGQGPVQIRTIAERQNIPSNYLEQILSDLKKAGLVTSFRGSKGGYVLSRSPESVTVSEVLKALEGNIQLSGSCCNSLAVKAFWQKVEIEIEQVLSVPLSEIVKSKHTLESIITYQI